MKRQSLMRVHIAGTAIAALVLTSSSALALSTGTPGITAVTHSEFQNAVLDRSRQRPVAVEFYATWCGPCHAFAPVIEGMAQRYRGRIDFYRVDVDAEPDLSKRFLIRGIPTVIFFVNGTSLGRFDGLRSAADVQALCDSYVAGPSG